MKTKTQKLTLLGILSCLALILSYIEILLPPIWSAIPGIKIGLPNIIIVFTLYKFSFKDAIEVSFIRIFISALLFSNLVTLIYSISGGVLSLLIMVILKRTEKFSNVGISIAGAVFHNLGQIIAAIFLLKTAEIGYYMIVLMFTGTIAGIGVGIASALLIKYSERLKL